MTRNCGCLYNLSVLVASGFIGSKKKKRKEEKRREREKNEPTYLNIFEYIDLQ